MSETLIVANGFDMWILAITIIVVVVVQTVIFYRLAKSHVEQTKILSKKQVRKALKIGVIGTIGPAIAVFAVAVALISQVGGPLTLARTGVIGSAVFEMIAAKIGSGGTVGTPDFSVTMLASAAWVMTLGGAGWLIMVFFSTKHIDTLQARMKKANPLSIAFMASFAPFIIFFTLAYKEVTKGIRSNLYAPLGAVLTGAFVVYIINKIVERDDSKKWLKEWAMGFAVIGAMIVGSIID